jgi:hypothetical protein
MRTIQKLSAHCVAAALILALGLPTSAYAQNSSILNEKLPDTEGHSGGEGWLPLSSLRSEPAPELVRYRTPNPTLPWKIEAHNRVLKHQQAWALPTLIHAAIPGVVMLGGIADQARRNPDCFNCGSEVAYAASLAFYFHISSVIAGGVTWISLGDMHTRIFLENDQARLVDRLQRTSRGIGVAAIVSGALAALSVGMLIGTNTDTEPWNNPLYDLQGLFIAGWVQNGLVAPIFAHIAITNAVIAEEIDGIGMLDSEESPTASRERSNMPRLLGVSPFGFSLAF